MSSLPSGNELYLMLAGTAAPQAAATPYSVAGAGSIAAGTYSYRVVAWPTQDETNFDVAGVGHYSFDATGAAAIWDMAQYDGVVCGSGSRTVTLNWAAPEFPPDHYTVYFQTAASYAVGTVGVPIKQVDGTKTAAVLTSHTPLGYTSTTLRITQVDAANKRMWVDGNRVVSLGPGTALTGSGAVGYTVVAGSTVNGVCLDFTARGLQTRITVNESVTNSAGDTLTLDVGPAVFSWLMDSTLYGGGLSGYFYGDLLGPVLEGRRLTVLKDMPPRWRDTTFMGYGGHVQRQSWATGSPIAQIGLSLPQSGVYGWDWKRILSWAAAGARLVLLDYNQSGWFGPYNQFRGQIVAGSWLGSGKSTTGDLALTFAADTALGAI